METFITDRHVLRVLPVVASTVRVVIDVTSTLEITAVTDLDIRSIMYQILIFSSEDPSVEIRLPPTRKAKSGTTVHNFIGKNQIMYYDS